MNSARRLRRDIRRQPVHFNLQCVVWNCPAPFLGSSSCADSSRLDISRSVITAGWPFPTEHTTYRKGTRGSLPERVALMSSLVKLGYYYKVG